MSIPGNEVAAANRQRRDEERSKSPIGSRIESVASLAAPAVVLGKSLTAGGSAGLAVAGSIVAGMGIVEWFRKLGSSKVNENLEALGQATEDALSRVENILEQHGTAIDEIRRRLQSDEFRNAMASASLQALRTTQLERLQRLALILANGVRENDLPQESTDDMMRAAVELKGADILLLGKIYRSQNPMLGWRNLNSQNWHGSIQGIWRTFVDSGNLDAQDHLNYRSSLARLESLGFIQRVENVGMYGVGQDLYALLMEGKKFYERLQEIAEQE
jgi:hypothetical protein